MPFEWWKRIPTSILLLLFLLTVYWFGMSGWAQYGDEIEKYRVAQSIVEEGDFSFRPTATRNVIGVGGQTYSVYELGQSVAAIPFYIIGRILSVFFPVSDSNWITLLLVGLLNPLLTALTGVVLFETCAQLGFGQRTSLLLALAYGLGTIAFAYAKGFAREPLLGLWLLLAFYAVYRFRQTNRAVWLLAAGIFAGLLAFTKFIQAIAIPFLIAYIVAVIYSNRRRATAQSLGAIAIFILPSLVMLATQILYALARFGTLYGGIAGTEKNPVEWIVELIGKSQPLVAIGGLLFSPEKSVFLYSPLIILGLLAWCEFFRRNAHEAALLLALALAAFTSNILRPDWDGGTWWGPRYLAQMTPLLVIPIGARLGDSARAARKVWDILFAALFVFGVLVQAVALFRNDRDFLDVTGKGVAFLGQLDFLAHGALDSLVVSASPLGLALSVNPFGVLLIVAGILLGLALLARIRNGAAVPASPRIGCFVLAAVLLVEFAAFVAWIVAPYPRVLAAQGDARYTAGNNFLASGRKCEATKMYLIALERETNFQREALARLDGLLPRARGETLTADDLLAQVEMPNDASVMKDNATTLSGDGALKLSLPNGKDATIIATSHPLVVQPNTPYALSGWLKTANIYGTGTAVVSVYEDDGNWKRPRTTDLAASDETHGWQPFHKPFTTLPTTQRVIVKASLWKTYGTVWIDGLTLGQAEAPTSPPCR